MSTQEGGISGNPGGGAASRKAELATFLSTCFIIIPGLAVAFVGAFGFVIWISQMIFGPPGPPAQ
ncbi:periplasmic nitrate reductase, NapE protein [Limibacillus halophilus]|jgi:nitrate reductase NapE component